MGCIFRCSEKFNRFCHWGKKFDKFEIPISFRHKGEDSYPTWIGGIITLGIVGCAIGLAIYDFIPFLKKKNYTLYYYTINLNETEEINLQKSKSSLAFGFECSNKQNAEKYTHLNIEDLLILNVRYIFYTNQGETKNSSTIGIHNCTSTDFYNDKNILNSIDKNKLNNLMCLNDLNKVIKNRYQDKYDNFTYYDIDIVAKNDVNISDIRDYLLDNDCKIELFYIDVKIDFDDYKNPIKPFLNEVFLQLDPDFHVRMNTFFMNEYFENNDDLFFPSKSSPKINNLFSRIEQYFLHRGANTGEDSFARIYIRADIRKMEIRRRYQTLFEFVADTFSFWDYIFVVCNFFLEGFDRLCLNYSIGEKLFFLKDKKNYPKNSQKIKDLLNTSSQILIDTSTENNLITPNFPPENTIMSKANKAPNKIEKKEEKNRRRCKDKCCISPKQLWDYFWERINLIECCCKNNEKCMKINDCCKCKKSKSKMPYYRAEEIINDKLEVVYYLKSILLLEIFRDEINKDKKEILKFISMPVISPKSQKKEKKDNAEDKKQKEKEVKKDKEDRYYKNNEPYSDYDFSELQNELSTLGDKSHLREDEKRLIQLVGEKLKEINLDES